MRMQTAAAALVLLLSTMSAAPACTSKTVASLNTPALGFRMLGKGPASATFSITVDTHTAAPAPYPQSGLQVKLLRDGEHFRQVMFPLTTRASFVADYTRLKRGRHELAAQLFSDGRLIAVQSRCVRIP